MKKQASHWRRHPMTGMAVELVRENGNQMVVVLGWATGPRSLRVRRLLPADQHRLVGTARLVVVQTGDGEILVAEDRALADRLGQMPAPARDRWLAAIARLSRFHQDLPREHSPAGVKLAPDAAEEHRLVAAGPDAPLALEFWTRRLAGDARLARRVPRRLRRGLRSCRLVETRFAPRGGRNSVTVRAIVALNGRGAVVWAMDAWSGNDSPPSLDELARRARGRRMLEAAEYRWQVARRQVETNGRRRPRR
jgi:hypothetical protein